MQSSDILQLKISSPKQTFYEGPALSVSSINSAGKFDILPQHANFVTLVENQDIIVRIPDKPPLKFRFPLAIIHNTNSSNKVNIFTDIQLDTLYK